MSFNKIQWELFSFTKTADRNWLTNKVKQARGISKKLYHNPKNSGLTRSCFLCIKAADKKGSTVPRVELLPATDVLTRHYESRSGKWGDEVLHCLLSCNDFVAEEAVNHNKCMTNFRLTIPSENRRGSTTTQILMDNFKHVCDWLENETDSKLYTWSEIYCKMEELAKGTSYYTQKCLKLKLRKCCGEHIPFADQPGRNNFICFKDIALFVLGKFKKLI